jgi:hypothetical protein
MSEWRDVHEFEGMYQVNEYGTVRNARTGRELKARKNTKGYYQVVLQKDKKSHWKLVHRLVAMAFVPGYVPGLTVDHLNNIKYDNRANNLKWVTLLANRQRATTDGLIVKGSDRLNSKLSENIVCCMYILESEGKFSQQQIADFLGVSRPVVNRVLAGKTWKHVHEKKEYIMGVLIFDPNKANNSNSKAE